MQIKIYVCNIASSVIDTSAYLRVQDGVKSVHIHLFTDQLKTFTKKYSDLKFHKYLVYPIILSIKYM